MNTTLLSVLSSSLAHCMPYQPRAVFLTADLIAKIDALLDRAIRWGYSCELKMSVRFIV